MVKSGWGKLKCVSAIHNILIHLHNVMVVIFRLKLNYECFGNINI